MSIRMVRRFSYMGREFVIGPKLNLVSDQEQEVRSSIHHVGGKLLSPVVVSRLGAYVGGGI